MKKIQIITMVAFLVTPMISQADLLGIRAENRVQGGEHSAQAKGGNNNIANAASVNITGSKAREVNNSVRATGSISASANGNDNTVNSASILMQKAQADKVSNTVKVDTIGIRPTGGQRDDAYIVRTAMAAASLLNDGLAWTPRTSAGSTDANIPIALGIPAIAISGGGAGGGAHGTAEWYQETADSYKGPQFALLIVTALTGARAIP